MILLYRSGTGMSISNAHRKQLQNFVRDRVVHETGSHIFYLSSVIFGSGICKYPQAGISFSVTGRIMGKPSFALIHLIQPYDAFYMEREDRKYVKCPITPSDLIHRCF